MNTKKFIGLILIIMTLSISGCATVEKSKSYAEQTIKTGDLTICKNLKKPYFVNLCYEIAAIETQNLTICDEIVDIDYSDIKEAIPNLSFKSKCYLEIGTDTQNLTICSQIAKEDDRNKCYYLIGQEVGFSEDICTSTSNSKGVRDLCFKDLAIEKQNSAYCDTIEWAPMKETCLTGINKAT